MWHPNREKRSYKETVPKKDKAPDKGARRGHCLIFNDFTSDPLRLHGIGLCRACSKKRPRLNTGASLSIT
jgi:hypothetical protein